MSKRRLWDIVLTTAASTFMNVPLCVARHILSNIELFGLLCQLPGRLIHRRPLFLVEDAHVLLLSFHGQRQGFDTVMRIMIGRQRRNRGIPGIKGVIKCWAGAERVNEREAMMGHTLFNQCRQFLWLG